MTYNSAYNYGLEPLRPLKKQTKHQMHSLQVTEPQETETKMEGRMDTICFNFLLDTARFLCNFEK